MKNRKKFLLGLCGVVIGIASLIIIFYALWSVFFGVTGNPQSDYEQYLKYKPKNIITFRELERQINHGGNRKWGTTVNYLANHWKLFKALRYLKSAAKQGHAEAQYDLAVHYFHGLGVDKNVKKSDKWLVKSAENESPRGLRELGYCYLKGKYFPKDNKKALELLSKAVEKGDTKAEYDFCLMYHYGEAVEKNDKKAFEFAIKAADKNYSLAQNYIGSAYNNGWGVKKDYKKAFEWYQKAADNNNYNAFYNLAKMYYNGWGVKKDYKKTFELCRKAKYKNAGATYMLGYLYMRGWGVKKDYKKAFDIFDYCAECYKDTFAYEKLSRMYYFGMGCKKDYKKAFKWANKALENKNLNSINILPLIYREGKAVPKNLNKAEEFYRKLLNEKPACGYNGLAWMWAEEGVNLDEAEKFVKEALKLKPENANIIDTLGWVYYKQKKYKKAVEELKRAAEKSNYYSFIDHIGDAYYALGEKEKARAEWEKALKLCEIDELKEKIQAKLNGASLKTEKNPANSPQKPTGNINEREK